MENYNRVENNKYTTLYYLNNNLHRIDGPAIKNVYGSKFQYQNGLLHRIDGPAKEYSDGTKEWWFEGRHIKCNSQKEFEKLIKLKLFW